jgi:hypothetical protein
LVETLSESDQLGAVVLPEDRLDVERERELNRLAGRARGRDDDDAACRTCRDKGVVVRREIWIVDAAEQRGLGVERVLCYAGSYCECCAGCAA